MDTATLDHLVRPVSKPIRLDVQPAGFELGKDIPGPALPGHTGNVARLCVLSRIQQDAGQSRPFFTEARGVVEHHGFRLRILRQGDGTVFHGLRRRNADARTGQ